MKTYALIDSETKKVVLGEGGPFDGETLEDAQQEVFDTLAFGPADQILCPRGFIAARGWELVELTEEHERQYKEEAAS